MIDFQTLGILAILVILWYSYILIFEVWAKFKQADEQIRWILDQLPEEKE